MQIEFKGVEKFNQELDKIVPAIEKDWRGRASEVAAHGVSLAVLATENTESVDSGAYRLSHAVYQLGDYVVFVDPRVSFSMDEDIPSRKQRGLAPIWSTGPTFDEVKATAFQRLKTFEHIILINKRFYADQLERGSAKISPPRMIYATMEDRLVGTADAITENPRWHEAVGPSERPK